MKPTVATFPFLFGRAFIEARSPPVPTLASRRRFPFLFGRAFIEAVRRKGFDPVETDFPSFSEGLSLRQFIVFSDTSGSGDFPSFSEGLSLRPLPGEALTVVRKFPFLFGRAFIEASFNLIHTGDEVVFPFLFGRAFIEAEVGQIRG